MSADLDDQGSERGYSRAMPPLARFLALCALVAGLALPASASADSGSISNVKLVDADTVSADFSVSSDYCGTSGYCGFFSYARIGAFDGACIHRVGRAVWVSDDIATSAGTQTGTATFDLTSSDPFKICLWVYQADDREWAIASTVIDPASLSATPSNPPVTQATAPALPAGATQGAASRQVARRAARLRLASTRRGVARALRRKYGKAYTKGKAKKTSCKRSSGTKFRCAVSWRRGARRYKGSVVVTSTVARGVTYKVSVKRSKVKRSRAAR